MKLTLDPCHIYRGQTTNVHKQCDEQAILLMIPAVFPLPLKGQDDNLVDKQNFTTPQN